MPGSSLCSHVTARDYKIHSSVRAKQDRNIKANASKTPKPTP